MKKIAVIILCMTFIFSSVCFKRYELIKNNSINDEIIYIWWYEHEMNYGVNKLIENTIKQIEYYAKENDIKFNVCKYSYKEISYDDYVKKRNIAMASNKADIILDDLKSLYYIKDKAGDYSKLNTYNYIFDCFKNQYCIPMAWYMDAGVLNNSILDRFGIKVDELITIEEYYDIKQELKKKGLEISINRNELNQISEYYINKNNLSIQKIDAKYSVDKELVKKTLLDINQDLKRYYNKININNLNDYDGKIKDEKNGDIIFENRVIEMPDIAILAYDLKNLNNIYESYTVVMGETNYYRVPCLFINRLSQKENVYKLSSMIFNEDVCIQYCDKTVFGPVINTDKIKNALSFNKDWKYIGSQILFENGKEDSIGEKILNKYFEMMKMQDDNKNIEKIELNSILSDFIFEEIIKTIDEPERIKDYDRISDDFVVNLNVRIN